MSSTWELDSRSTKKVRGPWRAHTQSFRSDWTSTEMHKWEPVGLWARERLLFVTRVDKLHPPTFNLECLLAQPARLQSGNHMNVGQFRFPRRCSCSFIPYDRQSSFYAAIGFNVETVQYNNIKFQVWDLGRRTSMWVSRSLVLMLEILLATWSDFAVICTWLQMHLRKPPVFWRERSFRCAWRFWFVICSRWSNKYQVRPRAFPV